MNINNFTTVLTSKLRGLLQMLDKQAPMSTYSCFSNAAQANKTANTARNNTINCSLLQYLSHHNCLRRLTLAWEENKKLQTK